MLPEDGGKGYVAGGYDSIEEIVDRTGTRALIVCQLRPETAGESPQFKLCQK